MDQLDYIAVQPSLTARDRLPPAFAVRLAERKGVSRRASYEAIDAYNEPPADLDEAVLEIDLPQSISLIGLSGGYLIFDFSGNPDFCGGELPGLVGDLAEDESYRKAEQRRDGLVDRRAKYVNAFLTTLWVGAQQAGSGISPQKTIHRGNYLTAVPVEIDRWRVHGPGAAPPIEGWPRVDIHLPGDVFRYAGATLSAIHATFDGATFELLPLLQDCVSAFEEHKFSAALVIGWSVAEAVIGRRWKAYLDDSGAAVISGEVVSKARRERLTGVDFTASVVTEVLALAGRLDAQDRLALDQARKARNEFAHKLKACKPGVAFLAASTAAKLIGQDAKTDFRVASAYSYQT